MSSRLVAAVAVGFLAVTGSASAATTPNLIVNPGAEAGPGSSGNSGGPPPPGWTQSGGSTAGVYGGIEFPAATVSSQIGGGANLFVGGEPIRGNNAYTLQQSIDATRYASLIDSGNATLRLTGFLGGYRSQRDPVTVVAGLRDPATGTGAVAQIGPVTPAERRNATTLIPRSTCVPVPRGVRAGDVVMTFDDVSGSLNGYADNLSLTLSDAPCPAPGLAPLEPATPPQAGVFAAASLTRGVVQVRVSGSPGFVALADPSKIPTGSEVDTTRGAASLTSASGTAGATQTATFSHGAFIMSQPANASVTDLRLSANLRKCPRPGSRRAGADLQPSGGRVTRRRLWGRGTGRFRTRGRRATATVRGKARWLVQDSCAGTLVRVTQGTVSVRDLGKKRTRRLKAPGSYIAR